MIKSLVRLFPPDGLGAIYTPLGIFCLFFSLFLSPTRDIQAFPENVRLGYPSCSTCHVSPTGGGILTDYGRSMSEEMSTWSYEGEGRLLHGINLPNFINIGGDVRWLNVTSKSKDFDYSKIFFMQTETEIAVKPIKGLTVVATAGKYNEGDKYEYRRNYLLLDLDEHWHFRAGRFFPDFGILQPDHTRFIHSGQGGEQYVAEVGYLNTFGSLSLSRLFGSSRSVLLTDSEGYKLDNDKGEGYAVKVSGNLFRTNNLGFSYWNYTEVKYGPFAILSYGPFYLLYQYDFRRRNLSDDYDVSFQEVGWEFYRGIHLLGGYESSGDARRYRSTLKFLPRPHFEFLTYWERQTYPDSFIDNYVLMAHYYL